MLHQSYCSVTDETAKLDTAVKTTETLSANREAVIKKLLTVISTSFEVPMILRPLMNELYDLCASFSEAELQKLMMCNKLSPLSM